MIDSTCARLMLAAALLLVRLRLQTDAAGEIRRAVKTALWVGSSFFYYNNSMHGHVGLLIAAADPGTKGCATSVTISGSGINWHDLESHFKPGGVGSYSFDAGNNVVFNSFTKPFDVVIMMDCSQCPIHPQLSKFFTGVRGKEQRDRTQPRRRAGVLHVLGLCRQARDDRAARRRLPEGRRRQPRARHCPQAGVRKLDRQAARHQPLRGRQAPPDAGRHLPRRLHGDGERLRALAGGLQVQRRAAGRGGRAPAERGLGNRQGLQAASSTRARQIRRR